GLLIVDRFFGDENQIGLILQHRKVVAEGRDDDAGTSLFGKQTFRGREDEGVDLLVFQGRLQGDGIADLCELDVSPWIEARLGCKPASYDILVTPGRGDTN